jgi:hypothetical protein
MYITPPSVSFLPQVFKTYRAYSYIVTILKRNETAVNDSAFTNTEILLISLTNPNTSKT